MQKFILLILSILILKSCSENYESEAFTNPINCRDMIYSNNIAYLNQEEFTGSCIVYTSDNKKNALLSFVKGVPNGKHEGYYYPGEEIEYTGYRKDGEIHGSYKRYHSNGITHIVGKLRRGYRIGKWEFYNQDGKLFEEKNYINGKVKDSVIYIQ